MKNEFYFISFQKSDTPLLFEWFSLPHVSEWWQGPKDYETCYQKYVNRIHSKDVGQYLICHGKKPIKYVQWYLYKGKEKLPKHT